MAILFLKGERTDMLWKVPLPWFGFLWEWFWFMVCHLRMLGKAEIARKSGGAMMIAVKLFFAKHSQPKKAPENASWTWMVGVTLLILTPCDANMLRCRAKIEAFDVKYVCDPRHLMALWRPPKGELARHLKNKAVLKAIFQHSSMKSVCRQSVFSQDCISSKFSNGDSIVN